MENIPENSSAMTMMQLNIKKIVPIAKQIKRFVHRGMIIIWHNTMKIHITKTHNILELNTKKQINN